MNLSKHFDKKKKIRLNIMRKIFRTLCVHSGGKTHKEVLALPQGNEITNGGEATNATGFQ